MAPRTLLDRLDIRRIIADGDLDGLVAAAVLRIAWPGAEVILSHPAEIRSGYLDEHIDRNTAVCDLPFHPECGLWIDHHATNEPTEELVEALEAEGGHAHWRDEDSAARVAYDLFRPLFDLSSLAPLMRMVDRIDGGRITKEEFFSDDPVLWLSHTVSASDAEYTLGLLDWLVEGRALESIMAEPAVQKRIERKRQERDEVRGLLAEKGEVVDRLAVVRLQETGHRTNGYLVTAHFGDACDACLIMHGELDGELGDLDRWPLAASFYSNSFLHPDGGVFDLTRMATLFDTHGGGHANACGCRVMPMHASGEPAKRSIEVADVQRNLDGWMEVWSSRAQRSS